MSEWSWRTHVAMSRIGGGALWIAALSFFIELGELEESIRHNTPYEVTRTTIVVEGLCPSSRVAT